MSHDTDDWENRVGFDVDWAVQEARDQVRSMQVHPRDEGVLLASLIVSYTLHHVALEITDALVHLTNAVANRG